METTFKLAARHGFSSRRRCNGGTRFACYVPFLLPERGEAARARGGCTLQATTTRFLRGKQDAERQGRRGAPGFRYQAGARGAWSRPGTCSQVVLTLAARCPDCCQFPPQLPLFLIECLGAGHRTERGNTCFQQEKEWGEAPTRLPVVSHWAYSREPCKGAPRKPVEIIFQKDLFLFITPPPPKL